MTSEALDSLSRQELIALVLALMEQNEALAARVAVLEARLRAPPKTPGNSLLQPSKGQKANKSIGRAEPDAYAVPIAVPAAIPEPTALATSSPALIVSMEGVEVWMAVLELAGQLMGSDAASMGLDI